MEELLREVRETNSLLRLAFAGQISANLTDLMGRANVRTLVSLLAEGDIATGRLIEDCRNRGIARSTLFELLSLLERVGVVARPKRGVVALDPVAAVFLDAVRLPIQSRGPIPEDGTAVTLFENEDSGTRDEPR